jgi:hypothetical protein
LARKDPSQRVRVIVRLPWDGPPPTQMSWDLLPDLPEGCLQCVGHLSLGYCPREPFALECLGPSVELGRERRSAEPTNRQGWVLGSVSAVTHHHPQRAPSVPRFVFHSRRRCSQDRQKRSRALGIQPNPHIQGMESCWGERHPRTLPRQSSLRPRHGAKGWKEAAIALTVLRDRIDKFLEAA